MFLVRLAFRNPYLISALAIGLCLLGATVVPRLPTDILPDFKKPVVASFFSYPGLPTVEMEKSVTSRVERALTLAGGLERIESRTMPGASLIKIFFEAGTNPSSAMNDIVNLEASDMFHLPPGIEFPFTLRSEPANEPVVLAAISGEGLSESALYTIGYYAVRNKMGGLRGVQIPHPFGGKFRQMMIYVDPEKMRSYALSPTDVVTALEKANLVLAGGTLKLGGTEYQVHPINTLQQTKDIDEVVVAVRGGMPVRISDIGYAKDDAALQYNIVRVNGVRSVYCPMLREPGENTIQVVDRIREGIAKEIPAMKARGDMPEAAEVALVNDQSGYIRTAIANLNKEVLLGGGLVALVILLFLGQIRSSLAVVIIMPLSLLIGMLAFYFTGHTLNVMTLGGLALAVGTVVDAGIVVVENISRHLEMGKSRREAALDGAAEVAGPVFAGTVTTLAIFIPAMFLEGMTSYLFAPLALAATTTIGASFFITMTVVPIFCGRIMRARKSATLAADEASTGGIMGLVHGIYDNLLKVALKVPALAALIIAGASAFAIMLAPLVGTELFPDVDSGTFEIRIRTTPGTRLEDTEKLVAKIEDAVKDTIPKDEILALISNIGMPVGKGAGFSTILSSNSGPDSAYLIVNLTTSGRSTSAREYIRTLRGKLAADFPNERFLFVAGGIINAALNEGVAVPIDVQIAGSKGDVMRGIAEKLVTQIRDVPGAVDVQIAQMNDYPQLDIQVDRGKAALFGLTQSDIAQNVTTALGSSLGFNSIIWVDPSSGTDFFMGVQYETNEMNSLEELQNLPVAIPEQPGRPASTVPLSSIATIKRVNIPGEISHVAIGRVMDVYVNVDKRALGSVVKEIDKIIAAAELPLGNTVSVRGPVATMREGAAALEFGLLTAIVLIFLALMAQFRSLLDPFIIILAVPLGLSGVVLALLGTGTTFNIQSLMGALMMVGVVVNNSILIVEFANQLLAQGRTPAEAAFTAARIRLRPILMTAAVLVASMLPLSFQFAPGNEAMIPLARALIGGMTVSTLLTLFLVPCVYALIKRAPQAAPQAA